MTATIVPIDGDPFLGQAERKFQRLDIMKRAKARKPLAHCLFYILRIQVLHMLHMRGHYRTFTCHLVTLWRVSYLLL